MSLYPTASGAPSPGLIGGGAAQTYGYPMTQGLIGAMSAPQSGSPNWTQVALQLAGNPHAGPYGASDGALPGAFAAPSGASTVPGASGGSSTGSQAIGLLGALAKNPSLLKDGASGIESLLGGSPAVPSVLTDPEQAALSSAFNAAPVAGSVADAMGLTAGSLAPLTASALAPVGTGAITAAGNAAGASAASELASALGSQAAPGAAAPAAAAAAPAASSAATGAGSTALGALAADAGALGLIGYAGYNAMTMPTNNGWSVGDIAQLGKNVQNATNAGAISPGTAGLTAPAGSLNPIDPNGTVNGGLISALQSLNQLELGDFGGANGYAGSLLNGSGYQTLTQAMQGKRWAGGGTPLSSGVAGNLLRKRA